METALVTGGAGFLGSHVAEHLLQLGMRVVVMDDLSGGFVENVPAGAEFCQASITDEGSVDQLFDEWRFSYVYHLAAYAAEGLSHFIRRFNYTSNLVGSANLINAAVNYGAGCFVFTSSMAVYGESQAPFSEETCPVPADPYGIAKLAVEQDLRCAGELFGLRYIVFRPHNVYGERQNLSDPYRNVVGIFMNQVMNGQPCTVFGDGTQTRAFSYVRDVAPLIAGSVHVPEAFGGTFNIGADEPHSVTEVARLIQQVMGCEVGIRHLPARVEVQDAWCDHGKLKRVFGRTAPTSLEHGLSRMAQWARTVPLRSPRPKDGIEIHKNLPPSWAAISARRGPGDG